MTERLVATEDTLVRYSNPYQVVNRAQEKPDPKVGSYQLLNYSFFLKNVCLNSAVLNEKIIIKYLLMNIQETF